MYSCTTTHCFLASFLFWLSQNYYYCCCCCCCCCCCRLGGWIEDVPYEVHYHRSSYLLFLLLRGHEHSIANDTASPKGCLSGCVWTAWVRSVQCVSSSRCQSDKIIFKTGMKLDTPSLFKYRKNNNCRGHASRVGEAKGWGQYKTICSMLWARLRFVCSSVDEG